MNIEQAKAFTVIPATPAFGLAAFDLQFYAGTEHLKIKAVDKATGASFTAAYLCPTMGGDPIKRELALNLAAMACAAPKLLASLKAILASYPGTTLAPELREAAIAAIALARREVPTVGVLSPEVEAAIMKHTQG